MEFPFQSELIKLTSEQTAYFLARPESGMGYQLLFSAKFKKELPIVSNAEILIDLESNSNIPIITEFDKSRFDFSTLEESLFKGYLTDIYALKINDKYQTLPSNQSSSHPPYLYVSRAGDEFRRLSAFRNDRRILADGSVLAGTYGTSLSDLTVVPSGIAAVGRYALPNRIAASYIYQIIPEPGTHIYFGTVTPNYGLCGGGVEVFFPNGCGKNSARLIGTISEI